METKTISNDTTKKVRKLKSSKIKNLKLRSQIKKSHKPLTGSFKLMKENFQHIFKHKKVFIGISLVYFLVSTILVTGLVGSNDYTEIKNSLNELFTGVSGQLSIGIGLFQTMLTGGSNTATTESGGVYQSLLLILISLVTIWAMRQTYAKAQISIKDSFYKSMSPLIPFIIVVLFIGLQIVPLIIGTSIYGSVVSQGIVTTMLEKLLWMLLVVVLFAVTIFMLSSSIFALYIVTLPNVLPLSALRSAKELVRHRRWTVIRKVIFLPICLLILSAIVMIPVLLYLTFIAQWFFIFLSMFAVVVSHGYLYRLYRELI